MIGYQLLRSFGYLAIRHPAKKVVDWYLPLLLATLFAGTLGYFKGSANVWGVDGLVSGIQGLIQGLPGFYIAALAAVATFGRKGSNLDSLIPEPTPTIETWYGSGPMKIGLTRRRFLCLLFAHLTALSILLSIGAQVLKWAAQVATAWPAEVTTIGFYLCTFLYALALAQLVVVTLWGLYYMSDKIHQPDAEPLSDSNEL